MRNDIEAYPDEDIQRAAGIYWHASASFTDLISGAAGAGVDLSPYTVRCRQQHDELSVSLRWRDEFPCQTQPRPGEILSVTLEGRSLANFIIEAINEFREARGQRSMTITCRARNTLPLWKDNRWSTQVYPVGTYLSSIARDVLTALGLTEAEIVMPAVSQTTRHTQTQLADMSAWEMLETCLFPSQLTPWMDALGRFKPVSRDVQRSTDMVLTNDRVLQVRGSRAIAPVTNVIIKWLDSRLHKSSQQPQILGEWTCTAGFFNLRQRKRVYFSDDRRQRAEFTWMEVRSSVNDGLLPVGDEDYTPIDQFHGEIEVRTSQWVPALATASLATLLATSSQPDGVTTAPGVTVPIGKIAHGAAEVAILLIMMSLGTGVYEVWGVPFDYVHATNTTEAYSADAPVWNRRELVLENDLIADEAHAQDVAINELLYRSFEAQSWGIRIVDDPRIELGDIIGLEDGSRIMVTNYTRDLSRGAPAILDVEGFRV